MKLTLMEEVLLLGLKDREVRVLHLTSNMLSVVVCTTGLHLLLE